jgi:hypothetical protein
MLTEGDTTEPAARQLAISAVEYPGRPPLSAPLPAVAVQPTVAARPAAVAAMVAAPSSPTWLRTSRMQILCARALELISAEEQACIADCAVYKSEISRFRSARDAFDASFQEAKAGLERAQRPLSEPDLSKRRLAEDGAGKRPDSLVRARRQKEWDRRLAAVSEASQLAIARLAEATREAELREELIRDRIAVARAAALRHHEFHLRRIATYLQQLMRTHKQGADLNMLLMRYPVGPDLPDWIKETSAGQAAGGDLAAETE